MAAEMPQAFAAAAVLLLLVGCSDGAHDPDYNPERAISADIDASRFRGAANTFRGPSGDDVPLGTYSWQFD